MIKYGNVKYERLSFLKQFANDPEKGIPKKGGIYYWVYWPDFVPSEISVESLEKRLKEFTLKSLMFSETILGNYKFHAVISEQGYPTNNDTMFGLSKLKNAQLIAYLSSKKNLEFFAEFFQEVCFARPFYIGKANNLYSRLANQHFRGVSSNLLSEIQRNLIPHTDIWVGYKLIDDIEKSDINNIFEEIFSRRIKPGLTKKSN